MSSQRPPMRLLQIEQAARRSPLEQQQEDEPSEPVPSLSDDTVGYYSTIGEQSLAPPTQRGYGAGQVTGPIAMLILMAARWQLSQEQLGTLLGLDSNEMHVVPLLLDGKIGLHGKDRQARIRHLLAIYGLLQSVFRDVNVGYAWLTEKKRVLGGDSPLERLMKGELEDILIVNRLAQTLAGQ